MVGLNVMDLIFEIMMIEVNDVVMIIFNDGDMKLKVID